MRRSLNYLAMAVFILLPMVTLANTKAAVAFASPKTFISSDAPMAIMIDPPPDFDIHTAKAADFSDFFKNAFPTVREERPLLEGTDLEASVVTLKGESQGPCVFILGGIHGDETAGWLAANLLKDVGIAAGTLHILSPANMQGARTRERYVPNALDLNRSFPGDPMGSDTHRLADAITQAILEAQPELVLDLHETQLIGNDKLDDLRNSLIFTSADGMETLLLEMILATQMGEICSGPFNFLGPGPAGSVNRVLTETYDIPVITVETFRGDPLEQRLGDQLDIVWYTLSHFGLI